MYSRYFRYLCSKYFIIFFVFRDIRAIRYLIKHEIFDNMNILRYIQDISDNFIWSICAAMTAYLPSFDSLYSSAKGNPMRIFPKQEGHRAKFFVKSQISRPCKGNGKPSENASRRKGD